MKWRSLFWVCWFITAPSVWADQINVLILGDSLSASYGMRADEGWVYQLQQRLPDITLTNASVSGETTGGGLRRLPQLIELHQPDWVYIELGGNDGLRGFPPLVTRRNLDRAITISQSAGVQVLLSEVLLPPNYGQRYLKQFQRLFKDLAEKHEVKLVPFFMRAVATDPTLMQADGIHPNRAAQPIIADFMAPYFAELNESSVLSARD